MSYVRNLFKKLDVKSQPKVYSSIDDLPQWNWNKVHETENLAYLKKLDNYRKLEVDEGQVLIDIWHEIYNEYLDEFGLSKEYLDMLEHKKRIARMKNEFIQTDNRSLLNFIKIEEMELAATFDKTEGLSFEQVVVGIERIQRQHIDVKKITVYQYNNYIRTLKENSDGE